MTAGKRFQIHMYVPCALACLLLGAAPAGAWQITDDMVGQSEEAWTAWQAATTALDRDEKEEAARQFDTVGAMNLSDLRLALMADRTGSLRLEQWARTEDAPASVRALVEKILAGRKQKALAEDGWHFAAIGRFKYADANFKALAESNPDPVGLLELARANPNRHSILIKLITNADVGPSAKRFLELLNRGEELLRMDPYEIATNIRKLGGPQRMAYNAAKRLKESGEFAIPHLIQFLQDPEQRQLHPAIIQVIPQIGRGGLNPLCIALEMSDNVTKKVLIDSLGRIGYKQAAPYLAKVAADAEASPECRAAANQALSTLGVGGGNVGGLFFELADAYYGNAESVKADTRRDVANVWYLRDGELRLVEVPTPIFNDIMAMRCAEEALIANADQERATALWVAANFRREAKLGMNVESDKPDVLAAKDGTRPDDYPRSIYFARAAGAKYNHMVLARAFNDKDAGVALGAIAALSETAGAAGLVGREDIKQPLVQTLAFPNRQVRIKAALALGRALPTTSFSGSENVIPVLAEALAQSGKSAALIADPDMEQANTMQAVLRAAGYDCAIGASLNAARESARRVGITTYDLVLLAADIRQPDVMGAVAELRKDLPTAATPILVVVKEDQMSAGRSATRAAAGVEMVPADIADLGDPAKINEQMMNRVLRASQALGMTTLARDLSMDLALQSCDVLRLIGESNLKVFDFSRAIPALVGALASTYEPLRVRAAHALALGASGEAQQALASAAMNAERGPEERVAFFGSLAESARRNGNLLGNSDAVARLIEFTMNEADLVLRAAASKALGALDLPSNKASEIIRAQYKG